MVEYIPEHFIGESIVVRFDTPPARLKSPPCPDGFTWREQEQLVVEKISEWTDFERRGQVKYNLHSGLAASNGGGSFGVGRFYFRVRTAGGCIFDLYYDRQVMDADDRLGHWYLYRELKAVD
jgi:hypothetical protein